MSPGGEVEQRRKVKKKKKHKRGERTGKVPFGVDSVKALLIKVQHFHAAVELAKLQYRGGSY